MKANFSMLFNSAIAAFKSSSLALSLKPKNLATAIAAIIAKAANITMSSSKLNPSSLLNLMDTILSESSILIIYT
jgi:hypothetical protein